MLSSAVFLLASFVVCSPTQRPEPTAPVPPGRERKTRSDDKGPPVLGRDDVVQAEGALGDLPPLAIRLEHPVASVDMDTLGRSRTELADLVASGDGFAVLVSDERDGARSYLLQRLDRDLAPLSDPERIDEQSSGKGQSDGSLAIAHGERLGAAWLDVGDRRSALRGRWFSASDPTRASTWSVPLPTPRTEVGARGEAPVGPQPALLWSESLCVVAWNTRGHMLMRELDPVTSAVGRLVVLGRHTQLATSGPRLALHSDGSLACAYDAGGTILVEVRRGADSNGSVVSGPGKLCGLAADANSDDAGWWLALRNQGRLLLRHAERGGATDRPDVVLFDQPWRSAELAVGPGGPCAIVQSAAGGLDALWLGDEASGFAITRTELRPAGTTVIAARLAFNAERWAFLWTEGFGPLANVNACASAHNGTELGAVRSLFGGDGSALQDQPAAAFAGDGGAVVWTDHRFGNTAIGMRGIASDRTLGAGELFLPAEFGSAGEPIANSETPVRAVGRRPAIAIQPSGHGLVAWLGAGASGANVFAQAIEVSADGALRATAAAVEVEPAPFDVPTTFAPAVLALRGERAFAVAWVRASPETGANKGVPSEDGRTEMRLARLELDGRCSLGPKIVGTGSRLGHPSLAQLDDGRIALAWEAQPHMYARRLAARIFSERMGPEGRELFFETMWRASDHSPVIAPAAGGFALAWTSGEDPDTDVFARIFDIEGRPLSRPLALSTVSGTQKLPSLARAGDGSFLAVWQDDLSSSPRLVGRRFSTRSPQLGPQVRFSFGPEPRVTDFFNPNLTLLDGGGFLLVGSHVVAGKGREVGLCIVGSAWDHVEGR